MGDKAAARAAMEAAGVPVVPGWQGEENDDATLAARAEEIGYPLMVKAAAGGGGKGMRIVERPADFVEAVGAARREASAAFGDDRLILERYIARAHHVEFQVLGDNTGKTLHLFERECSVQRRHQKIIEETPSPLLDPALRERMGRAAADAARAAGYRNAGTVEFIVDPATRQFYFLEMNTRLQVEQLSFDQGDLRQRGHAIECRLYAEDPANRFLPATGRLIRFVEPKGPGIRVDTGVTTGDEVSVYYDPLIAKLIAHGEDREAAIRRMLAALGDTVLLGVTTNWRFLQDVLRHGDFAAGRVDTGWIDREFAAWEAPQCDLPPEALIAAALSEAQILHAAGRNVAPAVDESAGGDRFSPWRAASRFRIGEG